MSTRNNAPHTNPGKRDEGCDCPCVCSDCINLHVRHPPCKHNCELLTRETVYRAPSASPLTDQRLVELIARVSDNFAARPASAGEERAMAVEIQTHRERMQWLCDASVAKLAVLRGDVCGIAEEAEERGEEITTDALYAALEKTRTVNGYSVDDDDRKLANDWAHGQCRPGKERIEDWGCVSDLEILIAQVRRSERERLMGHPPADDYRAKWEKVSRSLRDVVRWAEKTCADGCENRTDYFGVMPHDDDCPFGEILRAAHELLDAPEMRKAHGLLPLVQPTEQPKDQEVVGAQTPLDCLSAWTPHPKSEGGK